MADRKKSKPRSGFRTVMSLILVIFVVFCFFSIVKSQNAVVEKKQELAELEENIEVLAAENEELAKLIASDDIGKYMEKLAVESGNYAYPDERRYYDTSRDK